MSGVAPSRCEIFGAILTASSEVERLPVKERVGGSIPPRSAMKRSSVKERLQDMLDDRLAKIAAGNMGMGYGNVKQARALELAIDDVSAMQVNPKAASEAGAVLRRIALPFMEWR